MADGGMEREFSITNLPLPSQHHGFQSQQAKERAQAADGGHSDGHDMDVDDGPLDRPEGFIPLDSDGDIHEDEDDSDEEMILDDGDQPPSSSYIIPVLPVRRVVVFPAAAARGLGLGTEIRVARMPPLALGGGGGGGYRNGSFGPVPASAAAVAGVQKQVFRAGKQRDGAAESSGAGATTEGCSICFEEFADGEEVSVMPCSSGHEFHPPCIGKWLGISNMCPLCRHELPTGA